MQINVLLESYYFFADVLFFSSQSHSFLGIWSQFLDSFLQVLNILFKVKQFRSLDGCYLCSFAVVDVAVVVDCEY